MLTNDVVNFCICLRFFFGVGLQVVSQETVACGKISRNAKLDKFASTPGQRYHRRRWELPTLTSPVQPFKGPFRGAFNVAKMGKWWV